MIDIISLLDFRPNEQQVEALEKISGFIDSNKDVFILKGSAGTGKTSIVKAVSSFCSASQISCKIAAPTNRAAQIIGSKTSKKSNTIHSLIYTPHQLKNGEGVRMVRKNNNDKIQTIFIVDEASMISNRLNRSDKFFVPKPLLEDFIDFVKQGNPKNRIIFIGDKYQLPPVQEDFSPALDSNYLEQQFGLDCQEYELNQVMRQPENSDILGLATSIRDCIRQRVQRRFSVCLPQIGNYQDASKLYLDKFCSDSLSRITTICHTNDQVSLWNNMVREELGMSSSIINSNDVVVNQKLWMSRIGDWVYKEETGKILEVDSEEETYAGLHFRNVKVEFKNEFGISKIIKSKVLLESLNTRYGFLDTESEKKLIAESMKRNKVYRISESDVDDEYVGALRLRHGYASTCHKAQGGEWENVIICPSWKIDKDLKWTYTAVTRAKTKVFTFAS